MQGFARGGGTGLKRKQLGSELVDQEILERVDSQAKGMGLCGV